jgi:hypothetical protein
MNEGGASKMFRSPMRWDRQEETFEHETSNQVVGARPFEKLADGLHGRVLAHPHRSLVETSKSTSKYLLSTTLVFS